MHVRSHPNARLPFTHGVKRMLRYYLPVCIFLPCWNLGCLGLSLGFGKPSSRNIYGDIDTKGRIYLRIGRDRYRSHIRSPFTWRKTR